MACLSVSLSKFVATGAGCSSAFSKSALRSWIFLSVSRFLWAVSMSWLKDRLPLFLAALGGLRSSGSSRPILRLDEAVYVGTFSFGAGRPKSSSPIESESESELRTTCCPWDKIRLLAPELAEDCEVFGGSVSMDIITVSVVGVSSTVEVFEPKDMEGRAVEVCARSGSARPLELGGCETLSVLVFAVARKISLRLLLPVRVCWAGKAGTW